MRIYNRANMRYIFLLLFILYQSVLLPATLAAHDQHIVFDTIRVGGDNAYPPFEFMNENGEPDGFNIDVVQAIARVMDLPIDIELTVWNDARNSLLNGNIDVVAGMYKTETRDLDFDFTTPHFITSYSIFVRTNSSIEGIEDISDKIILVQEGDLAHDLVLEQQIGSRTILTADYYEALHKLAQHEGDCVLMPRIQGLLIIKENHKELKDVHAVGNPLFQREYCLAVREGNTALLALLDEGLSIIKNSGEFSQIYNRWFGNTMKPPMTYTDLLPYLGPSILILIMVILWGFELRRQVKVKTRSLRQSENNLANIIDHIPLLICVKDSGGAFLLVNQAASDFFQLPKDLLIGKTIEDLTIPDITRKKLISLDSDKMSPEHINRYTNVLLIDPAGKEHFFIVIKVNYTMIDIDKPAMLYILQETTEQRILEDRLRQSQKMEAIGRLAGGVAHDFNNQLTGIMGYAELLIQESDRLIQQKYINLILTAARHSAALTRQLLTFARKGRYNPKIIDFHDLIQEVSALIRHAVDKRIYVKTILESSSPYTVGDKDLLESMLFNICLNARDAMPIGGVLSIRTSDTYLDETFCASSTFDISEGTYVRIDISDTGTGITLEHQKKIFEPFFTTKPQGKGTGMGLAAVYGTVKRHKGVITMKSTVGKGTTFSIYLPSSSSKKSVSPTAPAMQETTLHAKHLLVIDDEELVRDLIVSILQPYSCIIDTAKDGIEGIASMRKQTDAIDVVLLDMVMPKLGGAETFKVIRKLSPKLPILLMSGYQKDIQTETVLSDPFCDFIQKPFNNAVLISKINNLCS